MDNDFQKSHGYWVVIVSFILAGFLVTIPLPEWLEDFRPEWVGLMVIYWVMALPNRIGIFTAWLLGFFVDVLEGSVLGLNGLVLAIVAYLALSLYQRLRMFTLLQQSGAVLVLMCIHQLLSFWILTASDRSSSINYMFMMSTISSALIWPFVFVSLRYLRRYFEVK